MPYATFWVPPDVALVHHGIPVYHAYREDDYDDPLTYWYTLNPHSTDDDDFFDIRDFPVDDCDPTDPRTHPAILRVLLDDPAWVQNWQPDSDSSNDPLYQLRCPRCQTEQLGFRVLAATFQQGPVVTRHGVLFTPDAIPDTVTIQCMTCQATFALSDLPREDTLSR